MTRSRLLMLLALSAVLSAGCGRKLTVRHYPDFYSTDLETLAVRPFESESIRGEDAGRFVTQRVVAALRANGTYTLLTPDEAGAAGPDPALEADLVLDGRVRSLDASRDVWLDRGSWGYGYGYYGWRSYTTGFGMIGHIPVYGYTERGHGYAAARIEVRDAAGQVVFGPERFQARTGAGYTYTTEEELLDAAARELARLIVDQIAVAPREITIDPGKALRTAWRHGGTLQYTDDFDSADGTVVVVLALPAGAVGNPFRVVIARGSAEVASRSIVWPAAQDRLELEFDMATLLASPEEPSPEDGDRFAARLVYDGQAVLTKDFELDD